MDRLNESRKIRHGDSFVYQTKVIKYLKHKRVNNTNKRANFMKKWGQNIDLLG